MKSNIKLFLNHGPDNPRNSEGAFIDLQDGRTILLRRGRKLVRNG
jgi:hypothetical protein